MPKISKLLWTLPVLFSVFVVSCNQSRSDEDLRMGNTSLTDKAQTHIATPRGITIRNDLTPRIEELLEKQGLPSVSLAVFDSREIIWAEAIGKANIAQDVDADIETVYNTGSTFKTIMVTAVMQLVEDGKIDLDQPLNTYLSEPIDDLADQGHPLTVRHTLTHHTGFENARTQGTTNVWSRNPVPTLKEQIDEIRVVAIPGETFDYCNSCFVLLADAIETVTERDLGDYLRDEILIPIGSKITSPLYPDATMTERMALAYEQHGGKAYSIPLKFLHPIPSGDVYLRPLDMAFFLQSHLDQATDNSKKILSQETVEMMRQPQFGGNITLGFLETYEDEIQVLGWDGGTPGGSIIYEIEPSSGFGIYIASNSNNTHAHLHKISKRIRDLLREADNPFDYENAAPEQITPPQLDRKTLQTYVGFYKIDGANVDLSINILNDGLALTNPAGKRIRLVMLDANKAILIGTNGEDIIFNRNERDEISSLTLTSGESSFSASKIP